MPGVRRKESTNSTAYNVLGLVGRTPACAGIVKTLEEEEARGGRG